MQCNITAISAPDGPKLRQQQTTGEEKTAAVVTKIFWACFLGCFDIQSDSISIGRKN
jgi:hypothetical protein